MRCLQTIVTFLGIRGKYHIAKIESRQEGNVGFKYNSAELRARLPIGKKFSISAGVIARTHEQAFGYNPVEIWLNETQNILTLKETHTSMQLILGTL